MREIILDIESTGLEVGKDRIIEVACVELFDRQPTGEELQVYINPQQLVGEEAIQIHGISNEFLIGKPTFKECWREIKEFISNSSIIAHHASFDIQMLNHELHLIGEPRISNHIVDTLILARRKSSNNNSLDALAKRYKIKVERRLHGALKDCYILASIYYFLTIIELEFDTKTQIIEETTKEFNFLSRRNPSILSDLEKNSHEDFILLHNIDF